MLHVLLPLCVLVGTAHAAEEDEDWGEDDWGDDDDAAGFSEAAESPVAEIPVETGPVSWGGTVQTEEALWLEEREGSALAKARQTADLWLAYRRGALRAHLSGHGEFDLAIWADSDQWDEPTIEAYQSQLLPREAWVAGSLGVTELTLGRQVVAWGEGRLSGVLDVVNPRDLREPGMVDLEDLRLPVSMARVTSSLDGGSVWPGTHRFELMVVPEADFGFRSSPLGPFGMLDGLVDEVELDESMAELVDLDGVLEDLEVDYVHLQDRWAADQLQSFARWTWRGRGLDLGVYAASVLDQQGTIVMPEFIDLLAASNEGESVEIGLDHRRYQLLGQSGVVAALGVLARWEVAYKNDLPVNVGTLLDTSGLVPTLDLDIARTDLVQGLVGASWSGWDGTSVDVDLTRGWLVEPPDDLLFPMELPGWALRMGKTLFKERLSVDLVAMGWGWTAEAGSIGRAGLSYEVADGIHGSLGAIHYRPGEERGPLMGLDSHDRLFGGLRWDF